MQIAGVRAEERIDTMATITGETTSLAVFKKPFLWPDWLKGKKSVIFPLFRVLGHNGMVEQALRGPDFKYLNPLMPLCDNCIEDGGEIFFRDGEFLSCLFKPAELLTRGVRLVADFSNLVRKVKELGNFLRCTCASIGMTCFLFSLTPFKFYSTECS